MKSIFPLLGILLFIDARSQVDDSMKEMEATRVWNETFFENVVGRILPEFTAMDLDGKTYTQSEIKSHKATFLAFWSESCAPCIAETQNLNRLYNLMKDSSDCQFYAIMWESEERVRSAIKKYDLQVPVLLISLTEVRKLIFERGYPTNMVLDENLKVRSILSGGDSKPGSGWLGFEYYWEREIGKVLRGDSLLKHSKINDTSKSNPDIVFLDSLSKIHSVQDLSKYFKNKPLFIDLWASWCLPCQEDFGSKNSIDSFLSKNEIPRIFISIDNPNAEEPWKTIIYKYYLKGYHLIAGKDLIKDLQEKVYKSNTINLPRYLIIKNGKIIEANAFRPMDTQKLLNQLVEKLL